LTIIEQNPKVETTQQIIDKVLAELDPQDISNTQCAVWEKDKPDCDLTRQTIETVKARNTKLVDMKDFNDMMCKQKNNAGAKKPENRELFHSLDVRTYYRGDRGHHRGEKTSQTLPNLEED